MLSVLQAREGEHNKPASNTQTCMRTHLGEVLASLVCGDADMGCVDVAAVQLEELSKQHSEVCDVSHWDGVQLQARMVVGNFSPITHLFIHPSTHSFIH
jgi:hypothetical protein